MNEDETEDTDYVNSEDIELAVEDEDGETTVISDVESVEVGVDSSEHTLVPITERSFEGAFEIEVDDTDLFESLLAGEMFESGMSKMLADDLDDFLSESSSSGVPSPMSSTFFEEPVDTELIEQIEVDEDRAETLLKIVYQKLNVYQSTHGELPEQLVLGLPQFKTIEAYTRETKDSGVEARLPVDEIIVVPGPQIHCVRAPYTMLEQALAETEDEND